jgi:hypothetical protein
MRSVAVRIEDATLAVIDALNTEPTSRGDTS